MTLRRVALGGGIELDVLDSGPRDAPALVFLHGFPESHRTWRHQIARFADRYRCIAPDQRGYRGSSKPPDVADYAPERLVGDVFALADALGVARFTVIGHDWGGVIAWGAALLGQHARVDRAVIANAPHPALFQQLLYRDPAQRAASQYIRALRDPANDALVREHGLGALLRQSLGWRRPPAALEPEERAALQAGWRDGEAALAMLNWYRACPVEVPGLDAPPTPPPGWQPPALPPLTIPTLVIWGMDDEALLPANLTGLEEVIDDPTIARIPGCGHFVPWEAPAAVNAAMEAFLARA